VRPASRLGVLCHLASRLGVQMRYTQGVQSEQCTVSHRAETHFNPFPLGRMKSCHELATRRHAIGTFKCVTRLDRHLGKKTSSALHPHFIQLHQVGITS